MLRQPEARGPRRRGDVAGGESLSGDQLLSGSTDGTIKVWRTEGARPSAVGLAPRAGSEVAKLGDFLPAAIGVQSGVTGVRVQGLAHPGV